MWINKLNKQVCMYTDMEEGSLNLLRKKHISGVLKINY